jgi:hypothetical protein
LEGGGRVDLQFDQATDPLERVAENSLDTPLRTIEVDQYRQRRSLDVGKQEGRAVRPEESPLNLGYFEVWIDRVIKFNKLAFTLKRLYTVSERLKSHGCLLPYRSGDSLSGRIKFMLSQQQGLRAERKPSRIGWAKDGRLVQCDAGGQP